MYRSSFLKVRMGKFLAYSSTTETSPVIATTTSTNDTVSTTSTMSGETRRTTEAVRISYTTDNGYVNFEALTDSFVLAHYVMPGCISVLRPVRNFVQSVGGSRGQKRLLRYLHFCLQR